MTIRIRRIDLEHLDDVTRRAITRRSALPDAQIFASAQSIVADVAARGDQALADAARRFGGSPDGPIRIDDDTIEGARLGLDAELASAIELAIDHVTAVHRPQRPIDETHSPIPGVLVERRWAPLRSVGVYVPGGRAIYPSSMIMGVVPARVAGVRRVVVATPAKHDGTVDPLVLATAWMLDVDEVYAMGGAQAIGALAAGTESIPPVDKIVGPGGPWVTAAKVAVLGMCGIDLPAGPSEAAIVADRTSEPAVVAADAMCQAEHGEESAIVIVVDDAAVGEAILGEITRSLPRLERAETIAAALERHGLLVVAPDIESALEFADDWAPEHLSLHTAAAEDHVAAVPNAGSVFVGHWSPEAAGDYATGANHVLPTGGLARAYGPLGVEDFGSWRQVQTLEEGGLRRLAPSILALAHAEGLTAHAHAVTSRIGLAS
jgi:histidinol dehydrogenase